MLDMPGLPSDLIDSTEAAGIVGVGRAQVVRWVRTGRLRGWQLGGRYRVSRADVLGMFRPVEAAPESTASPPTRIERRRVNRANDEYLRSRGYG